MYNNNYYMAGFVTPVAEKHSRRCSHASMHAWEENYTSLKDSYFEHMSTIRNLQSQESSLNLEMGTNGTQNFPENFLKNAELF